MDFYVIDLGIQFGYQFGLWLDRPIYPEIWDTDVFVASATALYSLEFWLDSVRGCVIHWVRSLVD